MGIDVAKLREKLVEVQSGIRSQGGKYFVPQYGETKVRTLPGPKGNEEQFFKDAYVVRINNKTLYSPKTLGQYCPIAKWVNDAYESENQDLIAKAKIIKPRREFKINIIVRELKDNNQKIIAENVGPRIYKCGIKVFEKLAGWMSDVENYPNFLDTSEGHDWKIVKAKKDGYPNYDGCSTIVKPCRLHDDPAVVQQWLSEMYDLEEDTIVSSPDEMERELEIFLSGASSGSQATTQSTKTQTQSSQPAKSKSQPAPEPEEEQEEDGGTDNDAFFNQLKNATNG